MLEIDKITFFLQAVQTPTPTPSSNLSSSVSTSNIDIKVLTQQLDFIQKSHEQLANNFDNFVKASNYTFQFFLGSLGVVLTLVTIVGGIVGWLFVNTTNKTLKETTNKIRKRAEIELEQVRQETITNVSQQIQKYETYVKTILERESVIDEIDVHYLLLNPNISPQKCLEFKILKERGFTPAVYTILNENRLSQWQNSVIVLDLENCSQDISETEIITNIENNFPSNSALVLYNRGFSEAINKFKKNNRVKFYHVANGAISLVGAVVDAAYVIKALRVEEKNGN